MTQNEDQPAAGDFGRPRTRSPTGRAGRGRRPRRATRPARRAPSPWPGRRLRRRRAACRRRRAACPGRRAHRGRRRRCGGRSRRPTAWRCSAAPGSGRPAASSAAARAAVQRATVDGGVQPGEVLARDGRSARRGGHPPGDGRRAAAASRGPAAAAPRPRRPGRSRSPLREPATAGDERWAPTVRRSDVRATLTTAHPSPTSPMTRSAGTHAPSSDDVVGQRPARHLAHRAHLDAVALSHVEGEARQPAVAAVGGTGAGEHDRHVGEVGARGPRLAAVEAPAVTVGRRGRREGGEVGAGAGLAEQQAPRLAPGRRSAAAATRPGRHRRRRGRRGSGRRSPSPVPAGGPSTPRPPRRAAIASASATVGPRRSGPGGSVGAAHPATAEQLPPRADGCVRVPVLVDPAVELASSPSTATSPVATAAAGSACRRRPCARPTRRRPACRCARRSRRERCR